ncbi:MAG: hypothetical protein AABY93_05135 [Bacteroidota bacterium]
MRNLNKSFILIFFAAVLFSCSDSSKLAPERNFYFEIKTYQNNAFNNELAAFLKKRIPQQKYTITNRSGLVWPYYEALELNEKISIDSLMPPHWYLHKMIFKDSNSVLKADDHLVRIDVMPQPDTLPNYRVEIYEMDSIRLKFTATSGIHFIDSTEFSSKQSLADYYLKSIVRYSFK